ncbi:hypothetical protein J5Y09_17175 [Roseomonas sp. PWR1]|uniref:Secreted protein n=1 Tax=Roseomonas nitratireducens TaxID=2820810 RepID=A0ABS4AWA9_9PROT|nr:hypothetical protein [Neoroseomonas nitratireducens]MBP0465662.1 hypothetical protein [Neoroseomonas nitratireducens]
MSTRAIRLGLLVAATFLTASLPAAQAQVHTVQGCNTNIRFLNQTNRVVAQLFYNPSSNSNWGPDRLGANVMRPGQVYTVRLSNAVPYDFRFVLDNGYSSELRRVNVCAVSDLVATPQGLRAR